MPVDQQDSVRDGWTGGGPTTSTWMGQSFTPLATHTCDFVHIWVKKQSASPGTCTLSIYATDVNSKPTGSALASGTFNGNTVSTSGEQKFITLSTPGILTAGTKYAWVLRTSGSSPSLGMLLGVDNTASYIGGGYVQTINSGASWTVDDSYDLTFAEGESAGLTVTVTHEKALTTTVTPEKALTCAMSFEGA